MTEKAKTDEKVLQEKTRLVIAVAVIAVIFSVLSPHIQEDSQPLQVGDELAQCYEEEHVV